MKGIINASCDDLGNAQLGVLLRGMHALNHAQVHAMDCGMLKVLLSNGAFIDQRNHKNMMPIHDDIVFKHPNLIAIIAQHAGSANLSGNEGKTLLYFLEELSEERIQASKEQVVELVKILLKNGASLEGITNVIYKSEQLLSVMLESSEDTVKARDSEGNTLLHKYLENGENKLETLRMLVAKGAEVDITNEKGETPIHVAACFGEFEALRFLISHSGDVTVRDVDGDSALHALLSNEVVEGTAYAAKVVEIVEMFFEKGLSVDGANADGQTYLHVACQYLLLDVCRVLVQRGADARIRDYWGKTGLHYLSQHETIIEENEKDTTTATEKEMVKLLVGQGCGINYETDDGWTALNMAADKGKIGIVEELIAQGADINSRIKHSGYTALHLAAYNHYDKIVDFLLKCGMDVNAQSATGKSALQRALCRFDPQPVTVDLLLQFGADADQRDSTGKTAVHWACLKNNQPGLQRLFEYGAEVNLVDDRECRPLHYATTKINANDEMENDTDTDNDDDDVDYFNYIDYRDNSLRSSILLHLAKLHVAGITMDETNERLFCKLAPRYLCHKELGTEELNDEVEKMRGVAINSRISLCDMLAMSRNRLSIYVNNPNFQKIVASADLETRFPRYVKLIKVRAHVGKTRRELLGPAAESFSKLTGTHLPESCSYKIFDLLDNEWLRSLIKAGGDDTRK